MNIFDYLESMKKAQDSILPLKSIEALNYFSKPQQIWNQNFSAFNMLNSIARSTHSQNYWAHSYTLKSQFPIESIISRYKIPLPALEAINLINLQHQQLFNSARSILPFINHNYYITQVNFLQRALGNFSGQIAAIATNNQQWDILSDFEEISNEAMSLQDRLAKDEGITRTVLNEIIHFFGKISIKFDKHSAEDVFWKIVAILSFLLSVVGEVRHWTEKPDYVTKVEFQEAMKQQFSIIESKLKSKDEFRITIKKCKVMLKPLNKTMVVSYLPAGYEVIILQIHHKWIYVSYINPVDSLPQSGWILKKHLKSNKKEVN